MLALLGLFLCLAASAGIPAGGRGIGGVLWSVSESGFSNDSLEDIREDGLVLVSEPYGVYGDESMWTTKDGKRVKISLDSPNLSLRNIKDGKLVSKISLAAWHDFYQSHPGKVYSGLIGPFRFLRHSNLILGVQYPWLVLMDAHNGNEIRRALPSEDLTDRSSPVWGSYRPPFVLALSLRAQDDFVAVAFNYGRRPEIFIYNSGLTEKLHTWQRERYINDICWSPDGKRIAVLYSGKYEQDRTFVGEQPKKMPVRLPDVEMIDAETGAKVVEFFTGGPEIETAFSPDGSLLYTISEMKSLEYYWDDWGREVIRVFSPKTGDLLRTIRVKGTGVRIRFAISRDGRRIAACAVTHPWLFYDGLEANERFVVLEAATGKVVFRCHKKTNFSYVSGPLLSSDGRELVVGFGSDQPARGGPQPTPNEIVAYSLP
jgi:WD40 repeat protein